jgi:hypothetical protein
MYTQALITHDNLIFYSPVFSERGRKTSIFTFKLEASALLQKKNCVTLLQTFYNYI